MARTIRIMILVAAGVAGCDADPGPGAGADIATDTIGDTIVTRTLAGGVWDGIGELVPELSIGHGVDGEEEYTFGRIASLAVDDDGNVYVLDGQASTGMAVPFSPTVSWAVHPTGAVLVGISSEYRIEVRLGNRVRRIERLHEPVPVSRAERDYHREFIERNMRNFQSDWTWEGPPIPEAKPPFTALHPARDGRIWVELSMEPHSESELWLGERRRYDVFEFDGTYLGAVDAPVDMARHPPPVFGADHVWAVTRDDLRIERVVRYRIEFRTAPPAP